MALANMGFKDQTLVSCLEEENFMGEENGSKGIKAKKVWKLL